MQHSPGRKAAPINGGPEGDAYLNERLRALEVQRQAIHAIADRLNLLTHPQHNGIKVAKFSLLTLPAHHRGVNPALNGVD
jgi:hypothetical protein